MKPTNAQLAIITIILLLVVGALSLWLADIVKSQITF